MTEKPRAVLIVANRTASTERLLETVRARAAIGPATFHLLVPATPRGLHRVVDPEVTGRQEAESQLIRALDHLRDAAGGEVSGHVGDADPMAAIADTLNERAVDEIIISTLPHRLSRWMHLDLPSKVRGFGKPVTHIQSERTAAQAELVDGRAA
jgi:hypothetical protein